MQGATPHPAGHTNAQTVAPLKNSLWKKIILTWVPSHCGLQRVISDQNCLRPSKGNIKLKHAAAIDRRRRARLWTRWSTIEIGLINVGESMLLVRYGVLSDQCAQKCQNLQKALPRAKKFTYGTRTSTAGLLIGISSEAGASVYSRRESEDSIETTIARDTSLVKSY